MTVRRNLFTGAVAAALMIAASATLGGPALAQLKASAAIPKVPANIQKAVDDPTRPEADRKRDGGRKPAEIFALAGLKPGDRVIEIGSFGQYDTNIIVRAIGDKGHVYMYDLPYQQARQEEPSKVFVAAHPNAEYKIGKFDDLTYPSNIDLVVIDMYYHDLGLQDVDYAVFNKKMYDALKKGGRVLIVDHNAAEGTGHTMAKTVHRIDPTVIPTEMQAAGFKMVVNSSIFANPADDKTKMVFAPGERGSTDRSVFVFQK